MGNGSSFLSLDNKLFNGNKLVVANPNKDRIYEIFISVFPEAFYKGRYKGMEQGHVYYRVNSVESNIFYIDMPKLTHQYITYLRFEDRVVKIVNSDQLILDGKTYKRIR